MDKISLAAASAVLASARCPVIASTHFGFAARQNSPQPVLCSIDRSPDSLPVLEFAAGFARTLDAPLAIVHAAGDLNDSGLYDEHWNLTPKGRIHDDLFRLQQECGTEGEIFVESGPPHEAVVRAAARIQAGLVIVRRSAPRSLLERLRAPVPQIPWSSPCPVLHI